jgi:hypothetical protein
MDGSILGGKLSVSELTVETKFGILKVPVDQITSFMPGLGSHPEFQQRVNQLVNDLAADTFAERERAQQALMKLGPDIRAELERQAKTAEAEKLNRLQVIIEDFQNQALNDDDGPKTGGWIKEDVIVTPGFTVVGRITTPGFAINSPFGTLNLKMEDVRLAMREGVEKEDVRKNVAVTGVAFQTRQYTNTGVRVVKGDQVLITASGSISMTPWSGMSGPDGGNNFGQIQSPQGVIYGGTLVAKIGDGGPVIKVGSKATLTIDRPGVLMLGIASQSDYSSYQFPGEYQVKITVKAKK